MNNTRRTSLVCILLTTLWLAATGCIQDPSSFESSASGDPAVDAGGEYDGGDTDADGSDADGSDAAVADVGMDTDVGDVDTGDVADAGCESDDECGDQVCVDGQCMMPSSCHDLADAGYDGESGIFTIDPPGNTGSPFEAHCDFDADGGAGYTMVRVDDAELQDDVEDYRQTCEDMGMELIVPRTRAHAEAILDFNDGEPPNVIGIYRNAPGAVGLHSWRGRCQGEPCRFYLSDTNSAGCGELQPDGTGGFDVPLMRTDDACFFGTWEDREDGTVPITGSVLCSTNDAGPPVHDSCFDYRIENSVYNAGPLGINGVYPLRADDGSVYDAYCDMLTHGGGWTLTMKIDGERDTFHYDAPLWTNDELYNPDAPDLNRQEAKLQSFVELPFSQLMVGLEGPPGQTHYPAYRYLPIASGGDSLYEVLSDDAFVPFQVGREAWKGTMADSSLQQNCNREGFNNMVPGDQFSRARIGIIGNEQNDCGTPDSRIGLGTAGTSCGQDDLSAGNTARCGGDAGDRSVAAMGALFVRDVPLLESCEELRQAGVTRNGIYPIAPGDAEPFNVYCEMALGGGGWTVVSIDGLNNRPQRWWDNDYPRPGASHYGNIGRVAGDMHRVYNGDRNVDNYSIDASELYEVSTGGVLAFVGGEKRDYITTELPPECNFFDGDTICGHNTYTGLTILHSDGSTLTEDGQACTTGQGLIAGDPYDEFGLHLLDGVSREDFHCAHTESTLGHHGIGRLYTTFNSSNGAHWNLGVHNFWDSSSAPHQPGVLMLR